MRTILKLGKWLGLSILLFLLLYLSAFLILPLIPAYTPNRAGEKNKQVFVSDNGVHCDIILPIQDLADDLLDQLVYHPGTQYLAFGWGDKGFYLDTPTWAELRVSVALKAMFLPSPTAMHLTEHDEVLEKWGRADLTEEQLAELIAYIRSSFRLDEQGHPILIPNRGYTPRDQFYEALGNYSCFKTCNRWVNRGLQKIDVKTAIWTASGKGIMRYLD